MEPWNIGGCGWWWGNLRWNLDHGEERGDPIEAGGALCSDRVLEVVAHKSVLSL